MSEDSLLNVGDMERDGYNVDDAVGGSRGKIYPALTSVL